MPKFSTRLAPGGALMALLLLFPACSDVSVTAVDPAVVEIDPASAFVQLHATTQLNAIVRSSDGAVLSGYAVNWTSLDPEIAEVDDDGSVRGIGVGTARIQATSEGVSGTASVTVTSGPAIQLSADTVTFSAVSGGANPGDRTVNVSNAGDGTLTGIAVEVAYAAGQPGEWLTTELSHTSAPAVLMLRASQAALPIGTYTAIVRASSPVASNDADSVVVRLVVAPTQPAIGLGANTAAFTAAQNGGDPATQHIAISNAGGAALTGLAIAVSYQGAQQGWLSAQLSGFTAPTTLALRPTTGSLPPGTYNATVSVTSPVAQNSPQTIAVTFTVTPAQPLIRLEPSSLTFSAPFGGANPPAQNLQISNGGGATVSGLAVSVTYPGGQPGGWLSVELNGTSAPAALTVRALTGALAQGSYTATIVITSSTAANSPQTVNVTFTVQSPLAPGAPTGLTANAVSSSRIDLAWNASSGVVTQYLIERATGAGGSFAQIASVSPLTRSHQDTGLSPATLYRYRVRACNTNACSGYSADASATTVALPAIGLSATSASFEAPENGADPANRTIAISNQGGGTLSGLNASVSYGAGASGWLSAQLSGTTAPTTLTLAAETAGLDEGEYSATVTITAPGTSNSPRTITVTLEVTEALPELGVDPSSLSFAAPLGSGAPASQTVQITNLGGGSITGLTRSVAYPGGQPDNWVTTSLNRTTAPATLTVGVNPSGLAQGVYTATISVATGSASNSPQTITVTFQVQPPLPPGLPQNFAATTVSSSRIDLSWGAASGIVGDYRIERRTGSDAFTQIDIVGSGARAYQDEGLLPGTQYDYRIRACNDGGCSSYVSESAVTTALPTIALSTGTASFAATQGGGNPDAQDIGITNGGGGTLSGLTATITYTEGQPTGWLNADLSGTTAPATITLNATTGALSPGTYTATVSVASGVAQNSPQTITVTFQVTAPAAPGTPGSFAATPVSSSRIDLSWSESSGAVTGYRIERRSGSDAYALIASPSSSERDYQDQGLAAGTPYDYRIQACNVGGCSAFAETSASTQALPGISLSANSAGFSATQGGADPESQDVTVTNSGGGTLSGLDASVSYAGGEPGGWLSPVLNSTTAPATLTLSASNSGLTAGSYSATVNVTSGVATNSPQQVSVTFEVQEPPPLAPSAPTNVVATPLTASEIEVTWAADVMLLGNFEVYRAEDVAPETFVQIATPGAAARSVTDTGLAASATYHYRVRACNLGGCSGDSNTATATTPAA